MRVVRVGWYLDREAGEEWLIVRVRVRATRPLGVFHGACFAACHLIGFMSALLPRWVYMPLHDRSEPVLRRWCEARPAAEWMRP